MIFGYLLGINCINCRNSIQIMRKLLLFLLVTVGIIGHASAQQDPMFTKYMFNSLAYNPGFAGSPEYLSVRALHRSQWLGIEGSPVTQSFSLHMPFKERVGLGLSVVNDKIGATGSTSAYFAYAYRVPFGQGKLSMGLQGGMMNWRADWSRLRYHDPQELDVSFVEGSPSKWMPNAGAGIFYYTPTYYVGFSVPQLISWELASYNQNSGTGQARVAKYYRHYYLTAGAAFPINGESLYFKPSILIKSVGLFGELASQSNTLNTVGAPTEFDIDASFLFYQSLWVGVSARSAFDAKLFGGSSSFDSVDLWMSYYLQNGLRIGASYDYTISRLRTQTDATFEVMIGYDFNFNDKSIVTPRYF